MRRRHLYNSGARYRHQGANYRCAGRQGLLHGPARARIPDEFGLEERRVEAVGLHRHRLALQHHATDPDRREEGVYRDGLAGENHTRVSHEHELHPIQRGDRDRLRGHRVASVGWFQGKLRRQFNQAAAFDRHRRQLDVAVRAAAPRPRQSHTHTKG